MRRSHIRTRFRAATLPPTLTSAAPDVVDPLGNGLVVLTGTNLTNASVTVGGLAATVVATSPTSVTLRTPALAAGLHSVVATTGGGSATLVNAITSWTPASVAGLSLFDAALGVTLGDDTTTFLATLPNNRTNVPFLGRDGASLHKVGPEFVQVAGWNGYAPPDGFGDGAPAANDGHTTNEVWVSSDLQTWTQRLAHGHTQFVRRHTHGAVTVGSSIVLVGGDQFIGDVYQRDVVASSNAGATWQVQNATTPWSARALGITGTLGTDIYHFGGQTGFLTTEGATGVVYNDLYRSQDLGVTWAVMDAGGAAGPTRPTGRATSSRMVEFRGRLWLVGGAVYPVGGLTDAYYNDCWSYHPSNGWQSEGAAPWLGMRYQTVDVVAGNLVVACGYRDGYGNTAYVWALNEAPGSTWTQVRFPVVVDSDVILFPPSHADAVCVDGNSLVFSVGNRTLATPDDTPKAVHRLTAHVGPAVTAWTSQGVAHTVSYGATSDPGDVVPGAQVDLGGAKGIVFDGRNVAYEVAAPVLQNSGRTVMWAGKFPHFDQTNNAAQVWSPNETIVGDASLSQFVAAGMDAGRVGYSDGSGGWVKTFRGTGLSDRDGKLGAFAVTHATDGTLTFYADGVQLGATASVGYAVGATGWRTLGSGLGATYATGIIGAIAIADSVLPTSAIEDFASWAKTRFEDVAS